MLLLLHSKTTNGTEPAWKSAVLYAVIGVVCALVIAGIVVLVVVLVRKQRARAAGQVVVVDPKLIATQPLDGTGEVYLVPLDQVNTVAPVSPAGGSVEYVVQQQ